MKFTMSCVEVIRRIIMFIIREYYGKNNCSHLLLIDVLLVVYKVFCNWNRYVLFRC